VCVCVCVFLQGPQGFQGNPGETGEPGSAVSIWGADNPHIDDDDVGALITATEGTFSIQIMFINAVA